MGAKIPKEHKESLLLLDTWVPRCTSARASSLALPGPHLSCQELVSCAFGCLECLNCYIACLPFFPSCFLLVCCVPTPFPSQAVLTAGRSPPAGTL